MRVSPESSRTPHRQIPRTLVFLAGKDCMLPDAFSLRRQARECLVRALSEGDAVASSRIIHFGKDDCHRVNVLRSAGYAVEDCRTLRAFREALAADRKPDAVFITEREDNLQGDAVSLSKSCSSAPLVLFRRSNSDLGEESFDLVIDSLTPPTHWLGEIGDLIVRGREVETGRSQTRSEARSETGSGHRPGSRFDCGAGSRPGSAVFES
jgi:hypothetical protein